MKTRCSFQGHDDLWPHELFAITAFLERNDLSALEHMIKHSPDLLNQDAKPIGIKSQGMLHIIADIVSGRLKREAGKKPSTERRDFEIYLRIDDLICDGYAKTTSTSEPCAVSIAADEFKVSEETANKAYQRFQKIMEPEDYKKSKIILQKAAREKSKRSGKGGK